MQPQPTRTFIDDLVSYFDQKAEVQAAYFAFLYSSVSETHDLFLGVEHTGGLEDIQNMTLFIKRVYLKESPMFFASTEHDPDTFALVKEQGLLFFSRQQDTVIAQELLKRLFDQSGDGQALAQAVREHGVYAMVNEEQLQQKKLVVQSFSKGEDTFTPLFSSPNMVPLGGLTALPPGLALARLTWAQHLAGAAPRVVLLNPDTAFEAQLEL
jgi:hypothetical protein